MGNDFLQGMADSRADFLTDDMEERIDRAARDMIQCIDGLSHLDAAQALKAARELLNRSIAYTKVSAELAQYYVDKA